MNEQKSVKLSFTAADLKQQPGMAVVTDVKAGAPPKITSGRVKYGFPAFNLK